VWLSIAASEAVVAVMVLDDSWIDQFYVDPQWTGRGIGGHLIEHAKSRRPDGLQLWTFVTNAPAQRFYQRHGFTVVETTDGSGNEENEPDLRLVWPAP
jgi:ribosomal protein S18 acetylase RimI-like enzyme